MKPMFTNTPSMLAAACAPSIVRQESRLRGMLPVASQLAAQVSPQSHQGWFQVRTAAPVGLSDQGISVPNGAALYLNLESTGLKLDGIRGVPPRGRPV